MVLTLVVNNLLKRLKMFGTNGAGSLRFQFRTLTSSGSLSIAANQCPFSCGKSRKRLLQTILKATEEEEIKEATASLAAANDISIDSAFDGIFMLKEKQKMALKNFFGEKDVFI